MAVTTATAVGLGAAGVGMYFSAASARKQAAALKEAGDAAGAAEMERLALARELMDEGKPLREALIQSGLETVPAFTAAATKALALLEKDILAPPGTSETFQLGLKEGTKAIMQNLAPYGLTDSSVASEAVGDLTEGLLAKDMDWVREARFRLAGAAPGVPDTVSAGLNLYGQAGNLAQVRAGLLKDSPGADLYADLAEVGTTAGSLGLLKMMKFGA